MEKLTKAEEEIMIGLWELKEATIRDVQKHINETSTPYTTIATVFRILEKKGLIKHRSIGKTYLYAPVLDKADYMKYSLSGFLDKYFEGSFSQLASFFASENDISIEDLQDMIQDIQEDLKDGQ